MDSNASYITNFFLQKHICLNEEWLEAAISMLQQQQQYVISSQDQLAAAVFEQWIFSDISQSTHPSFQLPDQNAKKIDGVFIFQITSVHDIGSSIYSQYRDATHKADNFDFFDVIPKEEQSTEMQFKEKTNRMLLFELSDGHNTLKAIEYRTIPKISSSIMPGAKILLHGSIQKRKDILWLTASNCQLLGGDLDTLCQLNQKEAFLGRKLKIEKYKNETVAQISQSNTSSSSTFRAAVQEISVLEDTENISPTTAARSTVPRKPKIVPEVITLSPCRPVATVQPIVQRNRQSGDGNSSIRGRTLNIPDAPEPFISANPDPVQEPPASRSRQSASNRGATFRFPDSPNVSQTETEISTSASEQIQPSANDVQKPRNRGSLNKGPSFRFPASPESSQTEESVSITSSNSSTPAQPVRNTVPKPRSRQSASNCGATFRFPESPDRDTSNNTSSTISEPLQSSSNTVQRPRNGTSKSSNRGPSFRFPASPEPEQEETASSSILSNAVEQNISTQPRPNQSRRSPPIAITTPPKSQIKLEEVVPETPEDNQPIIPSTLSLRNQQAARSVFHFPNNVGSLLDEKPVVESVNSSEDVRPPPIAVQKKPVKIEMPDDDDDDIIILETSPLLLPSASPKREIKLEENEVVPGTPEDNQPIIPSAIHRKSQTTAENAARKLVLDYSSSSAQTPIDKKMSQVEITENIPPPSPSRFSKSIQKRPLKIEIHDIDDDDNDAESNPQPSRSSTSFTRESPEAKKSRIINDPSPSQSSLVTKYKELKLSKIAQALNSMKFSVGSKKMKITAYMVDIVEPLNIEDDGEWTMKIRLKDETCEKLDCFLSNLLLCKLIGMTSDEAKMLKKSNNFDKRREGTERLKNLDAQLERLDLIFEIEFYAANRATPRIIEMETYTDALI